MVDRNEWAPSDVEFAICRDCISVVRAKYSRNAIDPQEVGITGLSHELIVLLRGLLDVFLTTAADPTVVVTGPANPKLASRFDQIHDVFLAVSLHGFLRKFVLDFESIVASVTDFLLEGIRKCRWKD